MQFLVVSGYLGGVAPNIIFKLVDGIGVFGAFGGYAYLAFTTCGKILEAEEWDEKRFDGSHGAFFTTIRAYYGLGLGA